MLSVLLLTLMSATANPDANGNYHVGDGVTAPQVIMAPQPELPAEARERRVSATVILYVVVERDGRPTGVHVAKSSSDSLAVSQKYLAGALDKNAIKAVEQDRFKPAMFKGKPVPVEIQVSCNYPGK